MNLTKILELLLSTEPKGVLLGEQLLQQQYPKLLCQLHITIADLLTATNAPSYKDRQAVILHNQQEWKKLVAQQVLPTLYYTEFGQKRILDSWDELMMALVINYINKVKVNGCSLGSYSVWSKSRT